MTPLKTISVALLLALSLNVLGQRGIDNENTSPYIEVRGNSEKEVVPDEIYISITIKERLEGKDKVSIEKQETEMKEAIKSIGVSLDNLSLSDANANYIKVRWKKKDVITKSEYLLKVGNAMTVGQVFEKLDELQIVDAYISKVSHSKLLDFKKEVRIMAVKAAKEKADYLLAAIGEETGRALIISEADPHSYYYDSNIEIEEEIYEPRWQKQSSIKSASKKNAIQFKKIKLRSIIYAKFEIK